MTEGGGLISERQLISLQGLNIDTNSVDKLFGQWSFVQSSDFVIIHDQLQFISRQDGNIAIGGDD